MDVKNRLKEFIKNEGITIAQFEKSIKAANGYVNSISKGMGKDKMLLTLEKYPNLNPLWLMYGKEPMYWDAAKRYVNDVNNKSDIDNEIVKGLKIENEKLKKMLVEKDVEINRLNGELLRAKDEIIQLLRNQSAKKE